MSDRSQTLQKVDYDFALAGATVILMIIGILFIYSSGITSDGILVSSEYLKQVVWVILGLTVMIVISLVDYSKFRNYAFWLYGSMILLLVYTRLFGRVVNGARSWIGLGDFGIQPSEFMKVATIIMLARFYEDTRRSLTDLQRFAAGLGIIGLPMALVLSQPDFGTSLVFVPIFLFMSFISGIEKRYIVFFTLVVTFTIILTVAPLYEQYILKKDLPLLMLLSDFSYSRWTLLLTVIVFSLALWGYLSYRKSYYFWLAYGFLIVAISIGLSALGQGILKDYQIRRLIVFLDPSVDAQGSGWNIIQSMTAIGSGGFWGKGFLQGTQSHYRFLPQQSTDFIFSIISEEIGFIGSLAVFALFVVILNRCVWVIRHVHDGFGVLLTTGVASMVFFHFIVNVGMTMGIMPITGIPLFFLSYGGSSLLSAVLSVGMVLSVYIRRFRH